MKRFVLIMVGFLVVAFQGAAQCAMCRSTLENNVSQGNASIAAGINTGILYLLAFPYAAALIIGYFWYRNARKSGRLQGS